MRLRVVAPCCLVGVGLASACANLGGLTGGSSGTTAGGSDSGTMDSSRDSGGGPDVRSTHDSGDLSGSGSGEGSGSGSGAGSSGSGTGTGSSSGTGHGPSGTGSGDSGPPASCTPTTQRCAGPGIETCTSAGTWGPAWACTSGRCDDGVCEKPVTFTAASCTGSGSGISDCGSNHENCCSSLEVPGGTFSRTYTNDGSGPTAEADPASLSNYRLDTYEVTVGRFRTFVSACTGASGCLPTAGSGKHEHLNGGQGLADSRTAGTYEPGWVASNDQYITPTMPDLSCTPTTATWTASPGTNETRPMNCANWYEAYAFCIWDGGFLPSETEWRYAAAGGSQERQYPWGNTAPGTTNDYAVFGDGQGHCYYPSGTLAECTGVSNIAPVGTLALGAGLWGQLDLSGNMWERFLDQSFTPYSDPCVDCGTFETSTAGSAVGGGAFSENVFHVQIAPRGYFPLLNRGGIYGFRCARAP